MSRLNIFTFGSTPTESKEKPSNTSCDTPASITFDTNVTTTEKTSSQDASTKRSSQIRFHRKQSTRRMTARMKAASKAARFVARARGTPQSQENPKKSLKVGLEFVLGEFCVDHFDTIQYMHEEFNKMAFGIENHQVFKFKLRDYIRTTSRSLKEEFYDQYPDFIRCSHNIVGIEDGVQDMWMMLRSFQKILQYQSNITFNLQNLSASTQKDRNKSNTGAHLPKRLNKVSTMAMYAPLAARLTTHSMATSRGQTRSRETSSHMLPSQKPSFTRLNSVSSSNNVTSERHQAFSKAETDAKFLSSPLETIDDIKWLVKAKKYYDALGLFNQLCDDLDAWKAEQNALRNDMIRALRGSAAEFTLELDLFGTDAMADRSETTSDTMSAKMLIFNKTFEDPAKLVFVERSFEKIQKRIYEECSQALQNQALQQFDRRRLTSYLLRLGGDYHNKGVARYFECRSNELRHRIRSIRLLGDSKRYCLDLSAIMYDIILSTSSEFLSLLGEIETHYRNNRHHNFFVSNDTSFLALWVVESMTTFYNHFINQTFLYSTPLMKIGQCLRITFGILNKLKNSGINVWIHIKQKILQFVIKSIEHDWHRKSRIDLYTHISRETWVSKSVQLSTISSYSKKHEHPVEHASDTVKLDFGEENEPQDEPLEQVENAEAHPLQDPVMAASSGSDQSPKKQLKTNINLKIDTNARSKKFLNPKSTSNSVSLSESLDLGHSDPLIVADPFESNTNSLGPDRSQDVTTVNICASGKFVYDATKKFLNELRYLLSNHYYPWIARSLHRVIISTIVDFLEDYCAKLLDIIKQDQIRLQKVISNQKTSHPPLSQLQKISLISNVYYVTHDLIPRIRKRLKNQFRTVNVPQTPITVSNINVRPSVTTQFSTVQIVASPREQPTECNWVLEPLLLCQQKLTKLYEEQIKYFAQKQAPSWIDEILGFEMEPDSTECTFPPTYCKDGNNINISQTFCALIEQLLMSRDIVIRHLNCECVDSVLLRCVEELVGILTSKKYAEEDESGKNLKQLLVDIQFFAQSCRSYTSEDGKRQINDLIHDLDETLAEQQGTARGWSDGSKSTWINELIQSIYHSKPHLDLSQGTC